MFARVFARLAAKVGEERGSAVLEFIFLGLILLVPVVYVILSAAQLQGGSFAVVGAADHAAKVFVAADTPEDAEARARQAALVTLEDFGFSAGQADIKISCDGLCLAPGSTATVAVRLEVPLPLIPTMPGVNTSAATVESAATQSVERFG
jgi:predicted RNase H-like HicB family nuclease